MPQTAFRPIADELRDLDHSTSNPDHEPAPEKMLKRLMAENADWLGPGISIDVRLYSALEWSPDEG